MRLNFDKLRSFRIKELIEELEKAYAFIRVKGKVFNHKDDEDDELCYVLDLQVVLGNMLAMAKDVTDSEEQQQHLKNYWSIFSGILFDYSMKHILHQIVTYCEFDRASEMIQDNLDQLQAFKQSDVFKGHENKEVKEHFEKVVFSELEGLLEQTRKENEQHKKRYYDTHKLQAIATN